MFLQLFLQLLRYTDTYAQVVKSCQPGQAAVVVDAQFVLRHEGADKGFRLGVVGFQHVPDGSGQAAAFGRFVAAEFAEELRRLLLQLAVVGGVGRVLDFVVIRAAQNVVLLAVADAGFDVAVAVAEVEAASVHADGVFQGLYGFGFSLSGYGQ